MAILSVSAIAVTSCGVRAPRPPEPPAKRDLAPMGYSIQAGAFSNVPQTIRLVEALERQGEAAYYFRDSSGLFKVCFGNFPTVEEARMRAESLFQAGVISEYQLIRPEDYAAARVRVYGINGLRKEIVAAAERFIGLNYHWGGDSLKDGFDCSGLTKAVYELNGLDLPRTSREQFRVGIPVARSELAQGDLVFFATRGRKRVNHVGVYVGGGRFIHAPGRGKPIRFELLSHTYYSRRYVGGRSYLCRGSIFWEGDCS